MVVPSLSLLTAKLACPTGMPGGLTLVCASSHTGSCFYMRSVEDTAASSKDKKKDYCCHKHELGCDSDEGESIGSMQIDCASDYINWQKWSSGKKLYCCDKYNLACEGSDHHVHHVTGMVDHIHAEPYDCAAGFDNWHRGWSRHKKGYCCDKYQLGCSHGYMGGLGWHDLHGTPGRVSVTTVHHHHIHVHG